ncbi:MAG TPA: BatA domain-containing protein [Thermogutta sp.]|nr:BatA domain-containing protein [Thermogutta sp.]
MLQGGLVTLGFAFLQPAMLGWAVAALIPILIHLWRRHRYHDLEWAAADFVLAALRTERRQILLRQYLLLLLRVLGILLVVFAAARPTFQKPMVAQTYHETTGWVFVIDDSLSMQYTRDDGTLFEAALERIRNIVQSTPDGDAFLLLRGATPVRWAVRQAAYNKGDFLAELNRLRCRDTAADWRTALQFVEQRLRELTQEEPRLGRFVVVLVTDGQETNWRKLQDTPRASETSKAEDDKGADGNGQITNLAEFFVLLLGVEQPSNTAITELNAYPANVIVGQETAFSGSVTHYGPSETRPKRLEWFIDDKKIADQVLNWTSATEAFFSWTYQFDTPGDHVVMVQLSADQLPADNQRRVVVSVKQERSVLCVDGRPSPLPFQGATGYLRVALGVQRAASGRVSQRIDIIPEGRLAEVRLEEYESVFLCDVSRLTLGEAQALREFVESGGGLIIFLGPRVNIQAYHESLGKSAFGSVNLLPGQLREPVSIQKSEIDPLGFRHPIVQVFQGRWASSLLMVPIRTYVPLQLSREEDVEVALRLTNGDPLIVTESIGLGRVVVVTTSADLSWTSLPLWTSYVPLIQEIQNYATSGRTASQTVVAGEAIGQLLPRSWQIDRHRLSLEPPWGERVEESLQLTGQYLRWSYANTEHSGIYRAEARLKSGNTQTTVFVANPPVAESDIRPWNFVGFVERVLPQAKYVSELESLRITPTNVSSALRASPLSRWLLCFVLVVLLGELYLGRHTPGT